MSQFLNIHEVKQVFKEAEDKLTELVGRKVTIAIEKSIGSTNQWSILLAFCEAARTKPDLVFSSVKDRNVANVRFLTAFYINQLLGDEPVDIARFLKRERTSIVHALIQVKNRIDINDAETMKLIDYVEKKYPHFSIIKTENDA